MSTNLVQRSFAANAAAYAVSPVHANGASLGRVVELIAPRPGWIALDVATGAGHMAAALAPHVARVIAADITPEMLAQTEKLAAAKGLANIETRIADAEAMPFADASLDLVTCRIAPHHFADVARFLAETARVLKPGGTFALVDNIAPDAATIPGFAPEALAAVDVVYNHLEKVRDPSHARALTSAAWRGLVAEAGLAIAHHEIMLKAMTFSLWCRNTGVPEAVRPRLRAMIEAAGPCLRAFLQPRHEGEDIEFMLREIVVVARKP